jgi:hypothetical protein
MGSKGGFYGFVLWEMKFLELLHTFYGFILMGRYLPTIFCTVYYGPQWMKEEQGSIFQQKKKKLFTATAGIKPLESFFRMPSKNPFKPKADSFGQNHAIHLSDVLEGIFMSL